MSDLILPSGYQNKVLDNNLKAFFSRYPHERQRLESLLSKPVENRPAVTIDVPACPSNPPIRILILAGINHPTFLATILNDPVIRANTYRTFIVENDPEFLAFAFQHSDLTQIINFPKAEWFLMKNAESIKPDFFRVLKKEDVAVMMRHVNTLISDRPQPEGVLEFYHKLGDLYTETVGHVLHNFGRIDDSLEGVRATLKNKKVLLNHPGIDDLKDVFRGIPALLVGAGPSLDRELATIKEHNDKYVVIAADAALKPLLKAGIRVDYVTSIERGNEYQKPFFEGLDKIETELVAFPVILPSQFDIYPGPIRTVYRNYSFFAYFEKSWPKGILSCGGSTSHLGLRFADYLGCSKVHLVGIDSCYENKEGTDLYRSHCSDTGYPEWGEFVTLAELAKRRHLEPIETLNNLGQKTVTNLTYYQWIKEYVEEIATLGQRMPITNCSALGIKMEGVPYKPLAEAASTLTPHYMKKPEQPAVHFNRSFKHKEAVENFKAWVGLMDEVRTECNELLKLEEMDAGRYEAVIFLVNMRIFIDPLFVAFVVQCCAKEFFELENVWWSLDQAWDKDQRNKITVTLSKLNLFTDVMHKIIKIFEEAKDV